MMCFNPRTKVHPKGIRYGYIHYPCGKCAACNVNLKNDFVIRLEYELEHSKTAHFVTITYDEAHLPADGSLHKEHVKKFMLDLRNAIDKEFRTYLVSQGATKKQSRDSSLFPRERIKYFLVGEYGDKKNRPHYHFIIFNYRFDYVALGNLIRSIWTNGVIVDVVRANGRLINYLTKYLIKFEYDDFDYEAHGFERPFRLLSNGLGAPGIDKKLVDYYSQVPNTLMSNGRCYFRMPRYFRQKLGEEMASRFIAENDVPKDSYDDIVDFYVNKLGDVAKSIVQKKEDKIKRKYRSNPRELVKEYNLRKVRQDGFVKNLISFQKL